VDRIAALRAAADFTIYTPGSGAGVGLDVVGSLVAPESGSDAEVVGDEVDGFVSGLLGLVDIDADPLTSREHILLSNLIHHEWSAGRSLDLPTLVGMVMNPPVRKLGVFDLDQFFPPKDRQAFAMRLNGLLASPSFGAWMEGEPLDIATMLRTPDGRPRCAIVTTAHLSDQERQFVTTLVLSKLVTWMRAQSGTTDLRALLYMDEVAGYLPPTAVPPTKKPILTLMKQARAFGVGVVLATQNPVDVDYKALSNAGTWMIGRLQTDRDKQRLLDGMSAASGGVDVAAVGDTISGLAKREFVLRRAGKDKPEVFTTRWAMSYLRGPLTRDQIATLMESHKAVAPPASTPAPEAAPAPPPAAISVAAADETPVMPEVAGGVAVRWADVAAPWLADVGGEPRGTRLSAAVVARVALHYDHDRDAVVHDEEFEAVLHPLTEPLDVTRLLAADYDDRDLRTEPLAPAPYVLPAAPIRNVTFFRKVERDLAEHLSRTRPLAVLANDALDLYARPGEAAEAFTARCVAAADTKADAETAALRDKYQAKTTKLLREIDEAQDKAEMLAAQHRDRRNDDLLDAAGSILGGIFGGKRSRKSAIDSVIRGGRRAGSSSSSDRLETAEHKLQALQRELTDLELELGQEVAEIDSRWMAVAGQVATVSVPLERSDVKVTQLSLVWIPVP
ncbi:MAG TPA: hypothetical protein VL916_15550, partial [Ilumatobacteraceae bacterium]|nr:hypothetical protein [Ilumatobacteraceae bacterium]